MPGEMINIGRRAAYASIELTQVISALEGLMKAREGEVDYEAVKALMGHAKKLQVDIQAYTQGLELAIAAYKRRTVRDPQEALPKREYWAKE